MAEVTLSAADHEYAAQQLVAVANEALNRLRGGETSVIVTIGQTFHAAEVQAMIAVSKRIGTLVAELTEARIVQVEVGTNIDRLVALFESVVNGPITGEPTESYLRVDAGRTGS